MIWWKACQVGGRRCRLIGCGSYPPARLLPEPGSADRGGLPAGPPVIPRFALARDRAWAGAPSWACVPARHERAAAGHRPPARRPSASKSVRRPGPPRRTPPRLRHLGHQRGTRLDGCQFDQAHDVLVAPVIVFKPGHGHIAIEQCEGQADRQTGGGGTLDLRAELHRVRHALEDAGIGLDDVLEALRSTAPEFRLDCCPPRPRRPVRSGSGSA